MPFPTATGKHSPINSTNFWRVTGQSATRPGRLNIMIKSPSAHSSPIIDEICNHNAGRDPERLALKYAKMALNPFGFLRGACHLFYDNLPDSPLFLEAPLA